MPSKISLSHTIHLYLIKAAYLALSAPIIHFDGWHCAPHKCVVVVFSDLWYQWFWEI